MTYVATEAIVNCRGMHKRINIVETRAWADEKVTAIRRQVGLGFIRPQGIESFADDVVANRLPVPSRGVRIAGVDVRTGAVVRQAVRWRSVGQMFEPAMFQDEIVIARIFGETRPDADHGLNVHVVKLLVHGGRIGKPVGSEIELAHFRVIEPVEHQHIQRQVALAIAFSDVQHFFLREIALLALYESIRSFGKHGRGAGE